MVSCVVVSRTDRKLGLSYLTDNRQKFKVWDHLNQNTTFPSGGGIFLYFE